MHLFNGGAGRGKGESKFFLRFFIRHIGEGKEARAPPPKKGGAISDRHMLECEGLSCLARLSDREQASRLGDQMDVQSIDTR